MNGTAAALQSENANLGTTVDTNRTVNLPLNVRKFTDLTVLTPGVRISNPDNHSSSTAGSTIASNSGRADWGAVQVDGIVMTTTRRPYPTFAGIRALDFSGASNYNALQQHLEWRVDARSTITASYVWSHMFDNQGASTNAGGCICADVRNPHEWAAGSNDQRHNLVIAYVYRLPDFAKSRLIGYGVNGWTLNGLISLASGSPVNVTQSTDSQNIDNPWQRPSLVQGISPYVANRSAKNGWYQASTLR